MKPALTRLARRAIALVVLGALGWFAGCSDNPGSPCSLDCQTPEGVIVSNAVAPGALTAETGGALALAPGAVDDVAYVSLAPGTVPAGSRASVRRVGDAVSLTTAVTDGGFDPVPVIAQAGDLIEVTVTDVDGAVVLQQRALVAASRRPIIVRTEPPPRKRDVPLNASLVIVFSEPVDGTTLTPPAVQLLRGGIAIAGSVDFLDASLDASRVKVAFVPDAPLAVDTDYELVVSQAVRDRDGQALAAGDTVPFTTGASLTGPAASISLSVDTGRAGTGVPAQTTVVVGTTFQMSATVRDAAGNELTDQPVTWFAADPPAGVLTVSATGLVTAVGDGEDAQVGASAGTVGTWTTFDVSALPAVTLTVAPTSTVVGAGDTVMLVATVRDAAGHTINHPSVAWLSSDAGVALVASTPSDSRVATVLGKSPGSVTITASSGTGSGTARITVGPQVPVASVTLSPPTASVVVQGRVHLVATLRDANGRVLFRRPTTWSSDNAAVVVVPDTGGPVTALGVGSAVVTATSEGVSGTAAITVTTIGFASLGASLLTTCGITAVGSAYCWGYNEFGQIGDGSTFSSTVPAPVARGLTYTAVSPGGFFACGLATGGAAYCWGDNLYGQLGNDSTASGTTGVPAPVAVNGGLAFSALSSGGYHACGLTAGGVAYCWGRNGEGALGDGSYLHRSVPVPVIGGLPFATLSSGFQHTCGLTASGAAYCWGSNFFGELGTGSSSPSSAPVAVVGGQTFAAVSSGAYYACGLTAGGAAYCWGNNERGQLGDGSTTNRSVPVQVAGGLTFASLSPGGWYTCGLTTAGAAYCWGDNRAGQLGNGSAVGLSTVPVPVTGGLSFAALSPGIYHVCGLTTGGVAYCWGDNYYGQVGDGSTTNRFVPVRVVGQP